VSALTSLSQSELIEIVLQLREEIAALRARVAELEEENRRLRAGKGGGASFAVKPSRPPKERKERKHRDRAHVRRREARVDEVVRHAVAECPGCGRELEGGWEHSRRQVIEVRVETRVVEHVRVARWCGVCGERRLPVVGAREFGVQGRRRFGASVQAFATLLHVGCRMPHRMLRKVLWELGGLSLSNGEVANLLAGTHAAGKPQLEALKTQLRSAPAVCADETGWRQDGKNGYLWGFFTPELRYYEYRDTRAGSVPVEVLGEDFGGVVTCDFYAGYNRFDALQRCWVHLLRDTKELAESNPDRPAVVAWDTALRELYREAKAFSSPRERVRRRARREYERRAAALARPYAEDPGAPQRVLSQRILKHLSELFVFVERPEVAGENNLAERSLRPAVIARKVSGGTRSDAGSEVWTGLMSLLSTWAAQGKPWLANCRELLLPTPAL
jgi:hypothetical protein